MVAIGYTMVYGVLRLINFAHSEIFMSGGFASFFVMKALDRNSRAEWLRRVLLIVSGSRRRRRRRPGRDGARTRGVSTAASTSRAQARVLISAIGASYFLLQLRGQGVRSLLDVDAQPYINHTVFTIFGAPVQLYYIVIFVAGVIMFVALDRLVATTKLGRGIRAVAQDAETASLMGVNIDRTIALTFIVGGFLGGAAGFLFGLGTGVVYTMGFTPALKAFTAAVLGGIGNLRGAVIGGLLLGVVESLSVVFVQAAYIDVVAFGILVAVLLVRPTGILGERLGRSA